MKLKKYLDHFLSQEHDLNNKHDWAWTNHVYSCLYDEQVYYVRVKKAELNPYEPLLFTYYFKFPHYYNTITHHLITPRIITADDTKINDWYFESLWTFIDDLQHNEIVNLIAHKRYFDYLQYVSYAPQDQYQTGFLSFYQSLLEHSPIVLCHNDLSIFNILTNQATNLFQVIDFELASYGFINYDIFNFIRCIDSFEQQEFYVQTISKHLQMDLTECFRYMFFVNYFAYTWAIYQTKVLKKDFVIPYIKQTYNQFIYWWNKIDKQ
ncbi:phosphotransferase [Ureaplasma miroungigenitalium]|uniref:Phosphotransferase n=1 Tax=Ureaplasma miroungigenitalium TaxID=1042321 RepID=A0ABT3BNL7_9BACT|nr:phosphotransferase [Ureaplasma miroungigenitalium]MCV3728607.1 phosphotransferase [Ureaplasma miroungigenitalium]MCV3734386.1 phosphotransferase [Ureaplasma miroungigenitalium]